MSDGPSSKAFREHRTLVLNADFTPMGLIQTCSAEDAILDVWLGRVVVIKTSEVWARSVNDIFNVPSVVALRRYNEHKALHCPAVYGDDALYVRDQGMCMYGWRPVTWGNRDPKHQATVEHIHPESQGGERDWSNCVLVSAELNSRKADTRLDQMPRRKRLKYYTPVCQPWEPTYGDLMTLRNPYAEHRDWGEFFASHRPSSRVLRAQEQMARMAA